MRRVAWFLLYCILLTTTVLCADQVSSMQSAITVNSDGSCQVTVIAEIHLETGNDDLTFPLPKGARNVRVNNTWVRTHNSNGAVHADISKFTGGSAGNFTLTFSYAVRGVVRPEGELGQVLTMPLLCGFQYPVEQMEFTVTLPGQFETKPVFSSGYYQESIESSIAYTISGATISGMVNQRLQDHETLTMRLLVPEELFLQSVTAVYKEGPYWIAVGILSGLALLYWILTLSAMPLRRTRCTVPPQGITAGELGCRLVHRGADLTMMVVSWAQLGYLLITMDESGRVFLHKRMEMGNERSAFENHYFRSLFHRGPTVDGTSYRYALLCQKAAGEVSGARADFRSSSGNPKLLRVLCVAAGATAGAALGGALVSVFFWRIVLTVLFCIFGGVASWLIHNGCMSLHLRNKLPGRIALGCIAGWVFFSFLAGQWAMMIVGILVQILGGMAIAYGGRRSELGRLNASEILGLRRYLKTVTKDELKRILKVNADFYHEMAPYALALGVDKTFAKQFEKLQQPNCSYLITGVETGRTAEEWYPLLREAVNTLDARYKRLCFEKLTR